MSLAAQQSCDFFPICTLTPTRLHILSVDIDLYLRYSYQISCKELTISGLYTYGIIIIIDMITD